MTTMTRSGDRGHTNAGVAAATPAIELRNLVKRYGATHALDDVSLSISAGSFAAILGPSGSGKTTLLNALGGFAELDGGTIVVNGRDITRVPANKRDIGYVFQQYALFPHMTIAENVAYPLLSRRAGRAEARRKAAEMLAMVELGEMAERYPAALSGGQQQRVALARALVYEPPVVLLDEPLAALDRRLRESLREELRQIHRRAGATFLLVTHDQEEALSMADQIVVMHLGRVEQQGTPAEVYDLPATQFVANFLGDCNLLDGVCDGTALVSEDSGTVLARGSAVPAGGGAHAVIRPEMLRLVRGGRIADGESVVDVTVDVQQFMGREVMLRCTSELGPLVARVPRTRLDAHAETATRPDAQVRLGWNPAGVHVIPKVINT